MKLVTLAAAIGNVACGGNGDDTNENRGDPCVPGASVACVGPGPCAGFQICSEDGTRLGPCTCSEISGVGNGGASDSGTQMVDAAAAVDGSPLDAASPPDGRADTGADSAPECAAVEMCNGVDDDCDGVADDGIDFSSLSTCGNCTTNCLLVLAYAVGPRCDPGTLPGTCDYDSCAPGYWDNDGNRNNGCEHYCPWNPTRVSRADLGGSEGCARDDDCDGDIDEDVDTCSDLENCGACGNPCITPHATPVCVTSAPDGVLCSRENTVCDIAACDASWVDADGVTGNGCEYECTPSGTETCDGIDNDCDRNIDNADDDLAADAFVGVACFGGTEGVCADAAHEGVTKCIAGAIECCDVDSNNVLGTNPNLPSAGTLNGVCEGVVGPFVLEPGEQQELCNGTDDDCDGTPDDGLMCP